MASNTYVTTASRRINKNARLLTGRLTGYSRVGMMSNIQNNTLINREFSDLHAHVPEREVLHRADEQPT